MITVTDPGSRQWTLTTDASGRITGVRRPGSAADNITYAYGADGTVSSATKDGVTTAYSRSVVGNTATETTTDALSKQTVTTSDLTQGRPTSFKDELSRTTAYEYDSNGRLFKVTQPELNYFQFDRDARGNVTMTTRIAKPGSGLAPILSSASFDTTCTNIVKCNKPNSTTDAKSNITNYSYDSTHGGITAVTQPLPTSGAAARPEIRLSYAPVTSASGDTVYEMTGASACQTGTAPSCLGTADETKSVIAYNSNLLPTSVTRSNGIGSLSATISSTYDSRGRVDTIDGPLSGSADTTKYRWDSADQLIGKTDPAPDAPNTGLNLPAVRLTYRPDGQISKKELGTVTSQTDAAWVSFAPAQTLDIAFDGSSRPVTSKLSAASTDYAMTQTSYDALGRTDCTAARMNPAVYGSLPSSTCTLSAQVAYGPDRINQVVYNAASEVTQSKIGVGTTDAAAERTLEYSSNGLGTSLTDGENNKTSYVYDGFDRLSQTRYPTSSKGAGTSNAGDYEQLDYDANDNVVSRRLRDSSTIGFTYDNLNRVTTKTRPSSEPTVYYAYDNLNRVTSLAQGGGSPSFTWTSLAFAWDALGGRISETGPEGTVTSAYDFAGHRTQITYPGGGPNINYDYRLTGEISAIRENGATSGVGVLASYSYDDLGNRTAVTFGNGAVETFAYDPVSRLKTLINDLSGTANDLTIGGASTPIAYNPASQITSATRTGANSGYSFTNMLNVNRNYASNGLNQYSTAGPASFTYDARGNLTSDGTKSFCYSSENLLTSSGGTCGSPSVALAYDPAMRLYQVAGATTTRFAYDGLNMIEEYDGSNVLKRRYVFAPGLDQPIVWYEGATIDNTSRRFMSADERGSIVSVTNSSGGLIGTDAYDEYGIPGSGNVADQRFGYTGQAWLPELGMAYYKARMYSPTLGRFMQTDPIGYDDGPNWYAYTHNDPVKGVDPLGLDMCPTIGGEIVCTAPAPVKLARSPCGGGLSGICGGWDFTLAGIFSGTFGASGPQSKQCGPASLLPHGLGLSVGGVADAGAPGVAGATANGSAGVGVFYSGNAGASAGAFASGGAGAYAGGHSASAVAGARPVAAGASAGAGVSGFITNAQSAQQLSGPFTTYSLNVGFGPIQGAISLSLGGGIYQLSVSPPAAGVTYGASASRVTTNTVATGGCR